MTQVEMLEQIIADQRVVIEGQRMTIEQQRADSADLIERSVKSDNLELEL